MAGMIVVGMFAVLGFCAALFVVMGIFLLPPEEGTIVLEGSQDEITALAQRLCWLRQLGLLQCRTAADLQPSDPVVRLELEKWDIICRETGQETGA